MVPLRVLEVGLPHDDLCLVCGCHDGTVSLGGGGEQVGEPAGVGHVVGQGERPGGGHPPLPRHGVNLMGAVTTSRDVLSENRILCY